MIEKGANYLLPYFYIILTFCKVTVLPSQHPRFLVLA